MGESHLFLSESYDVSLQMSFVIGIILFYTILFRKNALRGYEPNNLDSIHKGVTSMKLLETYMGLILV